MLLTLDVGNTNTVLGLYALDNAAGAAVSGPASSGEGSGDRSGVDVTSGLVAHWRVSTHKTQTADEYGVLFLQLFAMHKLEVSAVKAIIVSSVVPPLDSTLRRVCERYFQLTPMFVEPGIKTGMPLLIDNPAELGADRLVNGIAAFARFGGPVIVVDFGTATTFDVITARGEYIGGVIAPGLGISADALFSRAAKLARVDIKRPAKTIGTNTIAHLQSGLFYGYIGLVDGILERIITELRGAELRGAELKGAEAKGAEPAAGTKAGPEPKVVATGGLARMILEDSKYITEIDDMLTLDGLRLLYERNRKENARR
jgi:type III pantothenate kinase